MMREKKFVQELTCDELCMLTQKKHVSDKGYDHRIAKMAEREMERQLCSQC